MEDDTTMDDVDTGLPAEVRRQPKERATNDESLLAYLRLGARRSIATVAAETGRPERYLEDRSKK